MEKPHKTEKMTCHVNFHSVRYTFGIRTFTAEIQHKLHAMEMRCYRNLYGDMVRRRVGVNVLAVFVSLRRERDIE